MNDDSALERRYRRLLACYPGAFRREHEHEMLSVLMAGAEQGQRPARTTRHAHTHHGSRWATTATTLSNQAITTTAAGRPRDAQVTTQAGPA
jgi:hypothetical protein